LALLVKHATVDWLTIVLTILYGAIIWLSTEFKKYIIKLFRKVCAKTTFAALELIIA
jgi:hypothetical protein